MYTTLEYSIPSQSARSINSKSLLSLSFSLFAPWLSFSLNGERISLTESLPVFKENARQKNARDRFELFMKLLAAFRRKEKEAGNQGRSFNFLQTNTEFFQESCLHRGNLIRRTWLRRMIVDLTYHLGRFDFSLFKSLSFVLV